MSEAALLQARDLRKTYRLGNQGVPVLRGADFAMKRGEWVAILGSSGSGKSTLMHLLGLLDEPDAGSGGVWFRGEPVAALRGSARNRYRNRSVGFVFQFYHLLPELDAVENVMLPAMIAQSRGDFREDRHQHIAKALDLLSNFGLAHRLHHRPAQLSGGERQRVALARALFLDPPLLIADEPTGNLDRDTGEIVLELLFRAQEERNLSLLLVTHDERLAERCGRVLRLEAGRIVGALPGHG
jgi:lipoprotein-releasing system ATP-binding protein